ncbi:MAG: nucleotidyltransferase family protein [Ruminococcaceae bacterium]|nr:nucleotidyltransferase family protein [Oscillospiraceae bacterium]
MKTVAVICEYDPFHRGHRQQIDLIRQTFGAETTVISLMSGNVVQRGRLAIYPKHVRAAAAIACGSDLVLELPAPYACASAESFAHGAVALLHRMGGIDRLAFGSESGSLAELIETADILRSEAYREALRLAPDEESHPRKAAEVFAALGGTNFPSCPNDILSVQYLAALRTLESPIVPFTYRREPGFSASESRRLLMTGQDSFAMIPEEALAIFAAQPLTSTALYDAIALQCLRETAPTQLARCYAMNGGVAGLLHKTALSVTTVEALVETATCRTYTASRLRRAILAAVLGTAADAPKESPAFTNLLAANRRGCAWLHANKKTTLISLVTKPADGLSLPFPAREQFLFAQKADRLMSLCRSEAPDETMKRSPLMFP